MDAIRGSEKKLSFSGPQGAEEIKVKIPRGKEVVLADLTGPGKVTYS
jgi:hypothetical protein